MQPSPLDLTTLANVRAWLSSNGTYSASPDDASIQLCITAAGSYWLWKTGRGLRSGQNQLQSPFNQPVQYSEVYDGEGGSRFYLRNSPIVSVSSLVVNGQAVTASTGWGQPGFVIGDDGCSISLMQGCSYGPFGFAALFPRGTQNIAVTYTAGQNMQSVTNELQTIPATPGPYTVSVLNLPWLADGSISFFVGGAPLTKALTAPAAGQYFIQSPGVYLFNAADQGKQILMNYSAAGTPPDIVLANNQMVAVNYSRKSWIDQKSQAMAGGIGTVTYRDWELPPEVIKVMSNYMRNYIV